MIYEFNNVMRECAKIVEKHIVSGTPDLYLENVLRTMDYRNPKGKNFHYDEELYNAVYFIKYGYAYAYEYSVIYQIILDDYKDKIFGVTSFGCGSCIDAWSLAYANSKLQKAFSLRYVGTDLNLWKIMFGPPFLPFVDVMENAYKYGNKCGMYTPFDDRFRKDILEFFRNEEWQYLYNTVLFSKILNELPDSCLEDLIKCIQDKADHFKNDRCHYICISHSSYDYTNNPKMRSIAQRICDAINVSGSRFNVICDLPEKWKRLPYGRKMCKVSKGSDWPCYAFPKNDRGFNDHIEYLNSEFSPIIEIENIRKTINLFLDTNGLNKCVVSTSASLFQIIKLMPKK